MTENNEWILPSTLHSQNPEVPVNSHYRNVVRGANNTGKAKNQGAKGYLGKGTELNILQMTKAVYGFTGHMHGIVVKVKATI